MKIPLGRSGYSWGVTSSLPNSKHSRDQKAGLSDFTCFFFFFFFFLLPFRRMCCRLRMGVKWSALCITVWSLLRLSSGSVYTLQQRGWFVHVNIKEGRETEGGGCWPRRETEREREVRFGLSGCQLVFRWLLFNSCSVLFLNCLRIHNIFFYQDTGQLCSIESNDIKRTYEVLMKCVSYMMDCHVCPHEDAN